MNKLRETYRARRSGSEEGFTLIELLVVIIILGILAAVVVFAVGGIGDKGQSSACKIDTRTLRTAEEAYAAQPTAGNGKYTADEGLMVTAGFLSEQSKLHNIVLVPATATAAESFNITIQGPDGLKCAANGITLTGGEVVNGSTIF